MPQASSSVSMPGVFFYSFLFSFVNLYSNKKKVKAATLRKVGKIRKKIKIGWRQSLEPSLPLINNKILVITQKQVFCPILLVSLVQFCLVSGLSSKYFVQDYLVNRFFLITRPSTFKRQYFGFFFLNRKPFTSIKLIQI